MLKLIGFYDYTVILTYASLFFSVTGMTLAARSRFTAAVLCLLVCGLCDGFDGTVARSKKNRTEDEKSFGIQIDSLCDVVSFGVFPGYLCWQLGVDGFFGLLCVFTFILCGLIRLAFFNVLETKRQQTETGSNAFYRGLPITSSSLILPPVYLLRFVLPGNLFLVILHGMLLAVAFLFILDFSVKKPNFKKLLRCRS